MSNQIVTPRTTLRRPNLGDVDFILEIETDPEVYQHLAPGRPFNREQVIERIQKQIEEEEKHAPFGTWIADDKDTGEPIAWFMLMKFRKPVHELGYVVGKKHWGKGYGSEIAQNLVNFGFENGLDEMMAVTGADNEVSGKLLLKIGFSFIGLEEVEGEDEKLKLFKISKEL